MMMMITPTLFEADLGPTQPLESPVPRFFSTDNNNQTRITISHDDGDNNITTQLTVQLVYGENKNRHPLFPLLPI